MSLSSPVFGLPSAARNHKNASFSQNLKAPAIQFGSIDPHHYDLPKYQELVKDKVAYKKPLDFPDSIDHVNRFTPITLPFIEEALENAPASTLKGLLKGAKIGALEEGSDTQHEVLLLRAIQRKIITPDLVFKVRHDIIDPYRKAPLKSPDKADRPFKDVLKAIIKEIPDRDVRRFQKITGDKTLEAAQLRLALGVFKFAALDGDTKEHANQIKDKTRRYLLGAPGKEGEMDEFLEYINGRTKICRKLFPTYTKLFANLFFIPARFYYLMPLRMIRKELRMPHLPKEEMLNFQYLKQLWRQELHYGVGGNERGQNNGGGNQYDYDYRKALYKPIELLFEGWRLWTSFIQQPQEADAEQAKLYTLA